MSHDAKNTENRALANLFTPSPSPEHKDQAAADIPVATTIKVEKEATPEKEVIPKIVTTPPEDDSTSASPKAPKSAPEKPKYFDGTLIKHYGSTPSYNDPDFFSPEKEDIGSLMALSVEKIFVDSWFFKFPKEIRARIYRYRLFPQGLDRAPCPQFGSLNPDLKKEWHVPFPALLHSCAAIRDEALPIYYSEFRVATVKPKDVVPWLKVIGKEGRKALGGVCVKYDAEDEKRPGVEVQRHRFWVIFKALKAEVRKEVITVGD